MPSANTRITNFSHNESHPLQLNKAPQVRSRILLTGVLLIHLGLLINDAWVHSPNYLEANLLPAGHLHINYGRFDTAQVNTPLARMLCALPLKLFDVNEDWRSLLSGRGFRSEYAIGEEFIESNSNSVREIFFAARLVAVLFSLLGAIATYKLANRLYGTTSGLVAVVIWCFSPMILGHGATVNHDVAGAAMLVLAAVLFFDFTKDICGVNAILFGLFAGLAVLTRTTCSFVIGAWIVCFFIFSGKGGISETTRPMLNLKRRLGLCCLAMCLILFVLNLGYEFTGSMTRLGDFEFYSHTLAGDRPEMEAGNRFRGTALGNLPLPFPKDFILGLDLQQKDFESPEFQSYLRGDWRDHGWWYYYLYAWWGKTPIGFQLLIIMAALGLIRDLVCKKSASMETILLISIVMPFAVASYKHGFTVHYRYVLPALPFLAVLASRLWREFNWPSLRASSVNILLGYGVISSLLVYPHSMSYFNEWLGGPQNGGRHLLYSSCDWGQDMYLLQEWYAQHEGDKVPVFFHCHGMIQSEDLGLPRNHLPYRKSDDHLQDDSERKLEPGLYVISVSYLYGPDRGFRYLDQLEPVEHIGYSIKVFHVTDEDIAKHHFNESRLLK